MAIARAMVFEEAGKPLELRTFSLPALRPGEVLAQVTCCTLCGSDLHTFQGHRSTPTPTILGHEVLGTVAALPDGEPVHDHAGQPLAVGDRITWSVAASCGACFFCTHDLPQKCERLFKYGHERIVPDHPLSGGLAEFCHLTAGTAVFRVPAALPDYVACPANCATATVAAALRHAGPCTGSVVLVQGAGMLGLTAAAMAREAGAHAVLVCDLSHDRLRRASSFGATNGVLATDEAALRECIEQLTAGRGVDLALDLTGAAAAMQAGLDHLRIGGTYVWVGAVSPGPAVSVSPERVVRRMLRIQGVHNYTPADLGAALAFLERTQHTYPFETLVSASFPLAGAHEAFLHAIDSRAFRVAVSGEKGVRLLFSSDLRRDAIRGEEK